MSLTKHLSVFAIISLAVTPVMANTPENQNRKVIYVNTEVTTHLVMPENLKMVDISTDCIAGDQCSDNMVRLKPVVQDESQGSFSDGVFIGSITMTGERHIVQYDLKYVSVPSMAVSFLKIPYADMDTYSNPNVKMPEDEMARLAWAAYGTNRKFHNIQARGYGLDAAVYNIYSVGNYFFIDFVLKNKTNVPYDISSMRVKVSDKKESKSSNYQSVELTPVFTLNKETEFKKNYRQVLVLEKLTFPNDKLLQIEIDETQISGRVISLEIDYNDILNADGFNFNKLERNVKYVKVYDKKILKDTDNLIKENGKLKLQLTSAKNELEKKDAELKYFKAEFQNLKQQMDNFDKIHRQAVNLMKKMDNGFTSESMNKSDLAISK